MVTFLKKHRVIITSAALCLFALHIASTNTRGIGGTIITGKLISFLSAPVQHTITYTIQGIGTTWTNYIYLVSVRKENDLFKNEIAKLKEENNQMKEAVFLNSRLKELLSFKENAGGTAVAANVIGIESSGWIRTVTLNKGTSDGIKQDMAVVTPLGIVGRIIDIQPATSKALIITDPRCNIDAVVQRSRIRGIVEGNGTERPALKYVTRGDDIQIGDVLISSGLSGIFPKGMVIGEVTRIEKGEDSFFMDIEVKPAADMKRLEEVLIIMEDNA